MARVVYERADCLCRAIEVIVEACEELSHIDYGRLYCVASRGSRSRALVRIHGLSMAWAAVGVGPAYLVEVLTERFTKLTPREKLEVVVHELLHIPKTFSGALRPHGRLVNNKAVKRIIRCLESKAVASKVESLLEACP